MIPVKTYRQTGFTFCRHRPEEKIRFLVTSRNQILKKHLQNKHPIKYLFVYCISWAGVQIKFVDTSHLLNKTRI